MSKKRKKKKKPKTPIGNKYPVLIGVCSDGSVPLHGLSEVAYFIRDFGFDDDIQIFTINDEFFLDTSCGKINQCVDKDYGNALKQVLSNVNSNIDI